MKRLMTLCFMVLCAVTLFAQKDVTTFLGIPVDGTQAEMRQELIAKGFTAKRTDIDEFFTGEFNGEQVEVSIQTNNRKVCRINIIDANGRSEANIKQRYNTLVRQFQNNSRYLSTGDQTLSDTENISFEMMVNKKEYQAIFFQKPNSETASLDSMEIWSNKVVWFTILEQYGKYYIVMYYENMYNKANGDDL